MRYLVAFIIFMFSGCTVYNACRPMMVGVTWSETETISNSLPAGTYNKTCEYMKVALNGEYSYDCWY
jgi:hypothetical protein